MLGPPCYTTTPHVRFIFTLTPPLKRRKRGIEKKPRKADDGDDDKEKCDPSSSGGVIAVVYDDLRLRVERRAGAAVELPVRAPVTVRVVAVAVVVVVVIRVGSVHDAIPVMKVKSPGVENDKAQARSWGVDGVVVRFEKRHHFLVPMDPTPAPPIPRKPQEVEWVVDLLSSPLPPPLLRPRFLCMRYPGVASWRHFPVFM